MSEPMSSGEIEDVLSSIRRLVSEDLRPTPARNGAAAPSSATDAARAVMAEPDSDKLILTPALRVAERADETGPARPAPTALTAANPAADGHGASPPAFTSIRATPLTLDESLRSDLPVDPNAPQAEDSHREDAGQGAAPRLGAVLSSIGSAVDQNRGEWESETGDSGFGEFTWKRPDWADTAESPAAPDLSDTADDAARDSGLSPEEAEAAEAEARAEIEAAEREAAGWHDDDGAAYRDAPDGRGTANGAWFPGAHAEPLGVDFDAEAPDSEAYYDEALLRDLVRDILREELSGTLGERITRNVRKLVHAEIARALATRDFD